SPSARVKREAHSLSSWTARATFRRCRVFPTSGVDLSLLPPGEAAAGRARSAGVRVRVLRSFQRCAETDPHHLLREGEGKNILSSPGGSGVQKKNLRGQHDHPLHRSPLRHPLLSLRPAGRRKTVRETAGLRITHP